MKINQRIIVKSIVFNQNGELLLVQRKKKDHEVDKKWELPGGKIEIGERIETAGEREVLEESGYNVKCKKILIENYVNIACGGIHGNHLIIIPILCELISKNENHSGDKNVYCASWFKKEDTSQLNLLEGTTELLNNFI